MGSGEGMLFVSHVDFRGWFLRRSVLPDVADDTHDLHWIHGIEPAIDKVADGVLTGKCGLGQGFVDDRSKGCVIRVSVMEVPTKLERNSQRRKRAGGHDGKNRLRSINAELLWKMIDPISAIRMNVARRRHRCTGIQHSWQRAQPRQQIFVETRGTACTLQI